MRYAVSVLVTHTTEPHLDIDAVWNGVAGLAADVLDSWHGDVLSAAGKLRQDVTSGNTVTNPGYTCM